MYLSELEWYTLVLGFNSSQDFYNNTKLNYNKFYGFDLSWIIHQSGFTNLHPVNNIVGNNEHFITSWITELPWCLFMDCMVLLGQQIASNAELKQKWGASLSLNSYCKFYDCPLKLEIDFNEVNELSTTNY